LSDLASDEVVALEYLDHDERDVRAHTTRIPTDLASTRPAEVPERVTKQRGPPASSPSAVTLFDVRPPASLILRWRWFSVKR